MRKTTLFIAMSLDGYIAGTDGNINWLHGQDTSKDDMISYAEFIKGIDTVLMGWNTYCQLVTELSPDLWLYKDLTSYIITHRKLPAKEKIEFVNENICDFVKNLKTTNGKGIWICGGAAIIQPLIHEKLIDMFHISIIPTILGNGIRLFKRRTDAEIKLKLIKTQSYNGITDLIYEHR